MIHDATMRGWMLAAALVCLPASTYGGDWPQWGRTNERNMVSAERDLPDAFTLVHESLRLVAEQPVNGRVKWQVRLGSQTYGNPAVADGRVFIGTNDASLLDTRLVRSGGGLLLCLDEATGKMLWQLYCPRRVFRGNSDLALDRLKLGICSPPTVDGDRVYVVSNRGEVLCLDVRGMADGNDGPFTDEVRYMAGDTGRRFRLGRSDGDILWRCDLIEDANAWPHDATSSAVLVRGDRLYVGTSNGTDRKSRYVPRPDAPSVIVLEKRTGRIVAADDRKIARRLLGGQWSSPAMGIVNGRPLLFYGGGDGVCYAFGAPTVGANGRRATLPQAWSVDCNPADYRERDGEPIRYRARTGPSEIIATPVFRNGRVYVATGQDPRHGKGRAALTCIETRGPAAGRGVWVNRTINRSLSTAAIHDGLLYIADLAGILHCIDAATGETVWTHELGCPVWSSALVADGKVHIATPGRRLWILRAGRRKQVLSRIRLPGPAYTTPIAANGVLYLATQKWLFAMERTGEAVAAAEPITHCRRGN